MRVSYSVHPGNEYLHVKRNKFAKNAMTWNSLDSVNLENIPGQKNFPV